MKVNKVNHLILLAALVVVSPQVVSAELRFSPNAVPGGTTAIGALTFDLPSPKLCDEALEEYEKFREPKEVILTSSNPAVASVPASVILDPCIGYETFGVLTSPVSEVTFVTISATSSWGAGGNASLVVLPPGLNLSVRKMEVTQAIQYLDDSIYHRPDNGLALVKNKPTVVRVFLQATGQTQDVHDVVVNLYSRPANDESAPWKSHTPLWPSTMVVPHESNPDFKAQRNSQDGNVSFLVDPSHLESGSVVFRAVVNTGLCAVPIDPDVLNPGDILSPTTTAKTNTIRAKAPADSIPGPTPPPIRDPVIDDDPDGDDEPFCAHFIEETYYDDNEYEASFTFKSTRPLRIKYFQVYHPDGTPGRGDIDPVIELTRKIYPVDQVKISYGGVIVPPLADFTKNSAWWGLLTLLGDAQFLPKLFNKEPEDTIYLALLHPNVALPTAPGGGVQTGMANHVNLGAVQIRVAMASLALQPEETVAHELAHALDRKHAPCVYPGGSIEGVDPNWPDNEFPGAIIRHTGFDVDASLPLNGDWHTDLMGYCSPQWISPYTYRELGDFFGAPSSFLLPEPPMDGSVPLADHLVVKGMIFEDGSIDLADSYHQDMPDGSSDQLGEGPYAIVLTDADGNVLFTRRFDVNVPHATPGTGPFMQVVPYHPDTRQLHVGLAGDEADPGASGFVPLITRTVSPNPPMIQVIAPNGGEVIAAADTYPVMWDASDPDGDRLTFSVHLSTDGGVSWDTLATDLSEMVYELRAAEIPGSESAVIRVTATDGANSVSDESDGFFVIEPKAPQVRIVSPADGSSSMEGVSLLLRATGFDAEDGDLTDAALQWHSDIDGPLGSGTALVTDLSAGNHTVTLEGTDADGNTSAASIVVSVVANPESPEANTASDSTDAAQPDAPAQVDTPAEPDPLPTRGAAPAGTGMCGTGVGGMLSLMMLGLGLLQAGGTRLRYRRESISKT